MKPILPQKRFILRQMLIDEAKHLSPKPDVKPKKAATRDPLFSFDDDNEDFTEVTAEIEDEIDRYLADRDTDLQSLHKYPAVKRVFLRYNTTLPSSAPVERLFRYTQHH